MNNDAETITEPTALIVEAYDRCRRRGGSALAGLQAAIEAMPAFPRHGLRRTVMAASGILDQAGSHPEHRTPVES
jgi:hypothetical protein